MALILQALPVASPGIAHLVLSPWHEHSAKDVEISIQHNGGTNAHLDPQGHWQGVQYWIRLPEGEIVDGALRFTVSKELVDPILAVRGSHAFRIEFRQAGKALSPQRLRVMDGVLASSASGTTPESSSVGQAKKVHIDPPAPAVPAPAPEPVSTPEPEVAHSVEVEAAAVAAPAEAQYKSQKTPKKSGSLVWLFALIGVLALAAAAAAVWWFFLRGPAAPAAASAAITPPAVQQQACSTANLADAQELAFVKQCIQDVPDSEALLHIIIAARDSGKCGIAQRLYAHRAQAGDALIALSYAHEYDPNYPQASNCFGGPEAATARYWYEQVLEHDAGNTQAKQDMEALAP